MHCTWVGDTYLCQDYVKTLDYVSDESRLFRYLVPRWALGLRKPNNRVHLLYRHVARCWYTHNHATGEGWTIHNANGLKQRKIHIHVPLGGTKRHFWERHISDTDAQLHSQLLDRAFGQWARNGGCKKGIQDLLLDFHVPTTKINPIVLKAHDQEKLVYLSHRRCSALTVALS